MVKVIKARPHKAFKNAPDLHCHSTFSLLDGMGKPEAIVDRAVELSWPAVALTEHGWLASAPILYKAAKEKGIKPILGCELYVTPDDWLGVQHKDAQKQSFHLTTLALSAEGYHNMVAWTTFANRRDDEFQNFYHRPRISLSAMYDLAPYGLHHNVVFSGCLSGELLRFMLAPSTNGNLWPGALTYVRMMQELFPNFYLEFQNHRIDKFLGQGFSNYEDLIEKERKVHKLLLELHRITGVPCVITNDSHMQHASQRKPHLSMKTTMWQRGQSEGEMENVSDTQVSRALEGYSYFGNYMRPMEQVANGLPKKIRDQALTNVANIVREADINLSVLDKFGYSIPFSGYDHPLREIRKRSKGRLRKLEKKYGQLAIERFEHEIESMGAFAHYLLLMSEFIKNAKAQGILTHTRGSAANSILCYCLHIHDIDSLHYGLTFERFYNPSRKKLPDIDIDIDPDRYEDFMRYVKERMEELEGEGQVVQICNYGTLANRSAFRMVAESQGIPKETIDEISKLLPQMIDSGLVEEGEFDSAFEILKEDYPDVYDLTAGVFDSIKSVSQHACAWLLGTKERPIADWVPLCLIASSNTLVTQYNYKLLDKYFGLTKADFLRLKTLSVIRQTMDSMGLGLDKEVIPLDDSATYEMLASGDTEGVHSMQGNTQRQGCIDVQPENVFDLIAIQALYRPSGTRTGFDKEFVARRRGKKKVKKIHPVVDKVLGETYGLPIYQEQTLDIGYALGMDHADVQSLLDAIKMAKGAGRGATEAFEKLWPMFWKHAKKAGLTKDKAEEVWKLIDAFQGYGFNKGHATSYAILAAQTAYLKKHGAHGFWAALMNKYPEKARYVAAAKRAGFGFVLPDINLSQSGFSRGDDETIRVGLARIKGLGGVTVKEIVDGQPFASVDDLKERTSNRTLTTARLQLLAAVGALDSLGIKRPNELLLERKEKGKHYKLTLDSPELIELVLLGLTLNKPEAMRDVRPLHTVKQDTGEWQHLGLQHGVELTEGPTSVSKLFWIPPLPKSGKWGIYTKKASVWAKIKTNLLTAVDENGILFEIKANEDKPDKVEILDFLASKCRGAVICLDGAVRHPLLFDGPLTFQLFNVTGVYKDDPQLYFNHKDVHDYKSALIYLKNTAKRKKRG